MKPFFQVTLCLRQWKHYWMLYAVRNFDHLLQKFHYLCQLALTSESRILHISKFLFLDPSPHTFLCTSSAIVSCLMAGFMCTTEITWLYTISWVFGVIFEENRTDAGRLLHYTQPAQALQSSIIWSLKPSLTHKLI